MRLLEIEWDIELKKNPLFLAWWITKTLQCLLGDSLRVAEGSLGWISELIPKSLLVSLLKVMKNHLDEGLNLVCIRQDLKQPINANSIRQDLKQLLKQPLGENSECWYKTTIKVPSTIPQTQYLIKTTPSIPLNGNSKIFTYPYLYSYGKQKHTKNIRSMVRKFNGKSTPNKAVLKW